jgi:hypothetical protein
MHRDPIIVQQTDYAIEYIKKHAKDDKEPFFMDVNFI